MRMDGDMIGMMMDGWVDDGMKIVMV